MKAGVVVAANLLRCCRGIRPMQLPQKWHALGKGAVFACGHMGQNREQVLVLYIADP
jgi:hypothetical protein